MVIVNGNNLGGFKNAWGSEWPEKTKLIGNKAVNRVLARRMVTGKWDYAADHRLPGMLYARLKLSPHPHAKITSIDTSKAERLPGVKAIITYQDHKIMSQEVLFVGHEVAAVAATDPHIAEEALGLIDVKYEVLPFFLDTEKAMESGAPRTGIFATNVLPPTEMKRGDINKGLSEAEVTVEDTIGWTTYFLNPYLETRSCTASWIGDYLTCWTSAQNPFNQRAQLATELKLPLNMVRVISHGTGGGYGDKHFSVHNVMAALLAKKAGAPVQLHLSREENYGNAAHQFRQKAKVRIGAKKDGTLTAIDYDMIAEWCGVAPFAPFGADGLSPIRVTLKSPNGRFKLTTVGVNKPSSGAYRDVGQPSGAFIMNIMMWQLAGKLGMDPLDLYLKNIQRVGAKDQDSGLPIASLALAECLEKSAEAFGWKQKYHPPGAKKLPNGRLHGVGFSGIVNNKGSLSAGSGTVVFFTPDGTCNLATGLSSSNGGSTTALAIIVAETLGLASVDNVQVANPGDTATNQDSGGEGGSTRVITAGSGALVAALDARKQLFDIAADMLQVKADQLQASDGVITVTGQPGKTLKIEEAAAKANSVLNAPIIGRGNRARPPGWDMKTACASFAEIEVDPETGKIFVKNMVNACDVGRAIHWKGTENQIEGGTIQRLAQGLALEQILDNATGQTLNPFFHENKHLTILDLPETNVPIIIESIDPIGPYGAKGVGEPCVTNQSPALHAAFYNATGLWIKEEGLTPWRVLKALGKG